MVNESSSRHSPAAPAKGLDVLAFRRVPLYRRLAGVDDVRAICRTPASARAFTNKSDTVSLGHGRILFARRIQLFSEGVASLSGHTIAKISATPMPMDTSANR